MSSGEGDVRGARGKGEGEILDQLKIFVTEFHSKNKVFLSHKCQVKKEQLTKGQKRNAWRKGGLNEEDRQRGWNWVDVIK